MCTVSYVGDYAKTHIPQRWPEVFPNGWKNNTVPIMPVSREEFLALQKEVAELKKLLLAAKEFDTNTNQHSCETEDKVAMIKTLAKMVGVDLKDVFE